jgi:hypothetical protein
VGLQKRRQLGLPKHRPVLYQCISVKSVVKPSASFRGSHHFAVNDFVIHDFVYLPPV